MGHSDQSDTLSRRRFLFGAAMTAAALVLSVPALADDDEGDEETGHSESEEHDFARQSVEDGSAVPLSDILVEVQKTVPGDLLEARLKKRHGKLVYVLTILSGTGIYTVVTVDAKSNTILETKEK